MRRLLTILLLPALVPAAAAFAQPADAVSRPEILVVSGSSEAEILAVSGPPEAEILVVSGSSEAEILAVVEQLFDGMRSGDSAMVRQVFHPGARFQTAGMRDGRPALIEGDVDAFVRAVGSPRGEVWDERIRDVEIRLDGPLATAWMNYAFFVGDRLSHCGVNAFQLFHDGVAWKVFQITDTRRQERCEAP